MLIQSVKTQKRSGRRNVKMKLFHVKVVVQTLVGRLKQLHQSCSVSPCKCFRHDRIPCHDIGKAHGHVGFGVKFLKKELILIAQTFFFIHVNQAGLKMNGNHKESAGSHKGEKEKRDKKLPLKAYIV
jgi:hypothetical protein